MTSKILLTVIISIFSSLHPFHVSVTDIVHNKDEKSLQITSRVFLDDLELALNDLTGQTLDVIVLSKNGELDKILKPYFLKNFKLKVDDENTSLSYLGSQIDQDALMVFIEVNNVELVSKLYVSNTLIFEKYDDQSNIVHFNYNGKVTSERLHADKPFVVFER
ncbi:DUF6702 family protein [Marinigracilibium pacificum]|uniref:Uncharacterized protein n=1 Tax=Marinigracilibium pacificum TaxID=2729599 RepID=A0A848IX57_9BACT|nr:DUF6702 family protein [Marinigracilibium pacificum]NMM46840.1 hypothetical protein [Marinigracilibium pacificum]